MSREESARQSQVERVIALVTPWSGVQVRGLHETGGSHQDDRSALPAGTRGQDKLHVSVSLTALVANGTSVGSNRDDFGISIPRHVLGQEPSRRTTGAAEDLAGGIEHSINKMLGRDPQLHRPPRLAWGGLIDALARAGIVVTDQELINAPLTIDLSREAKALIVAQ